MFSLNRVVAFAGPYLSLLAGAAATWIIAKANALGIEGLDQNETAQQIASALSFTLAAGLTWLGQSRWLRGHQIVLAGDAQVQAAALVAAVAPPPLAPADPAHDDLIALGENLPSDEEEFAAPPPGDMPVQADIIDDPDNPADAMTGRVDLPEQT